MINYRARGEARSKWQLSQRSKTPEKNVMEVKGQVGTGVIQVFWFCFVFFLLYLHPPKRLSSILQ